MATQLNDFTVPNENVGMYPNGTIYNDFTTDQYDFTVYFTSENGNIDRESAYAAIMYYHGSDTQIDIPASATDITIQSPNGQSVTFESIPVREIYDAAFINAWDLEKVNIPDSVISIGDNAFRSCTSLTEINIPDSVTEIGEAAFNLCTSLTEINIPDSITEIKANTFEFCASLAEINIPDSITKIGDWAFCMCGGLTEINIPDSVIEIGDSAFSECDHLEKVNVPVINRDVINAFRNSCSDNMELTSTRSDITIEISRESPILEYNDYKIINFEENRDGSSFTETIEKDNLVYKVSGDKDDEGNVQNRSVSLIKYTNYDNNRVELPESLSDIPIISNVVDYYEGNVNIAETVDSTDYYIGTSAFAYHSELVEVDIPNSVTKIGEAAFEGCTSLTEISVPNSVRYIEFEAFRDCDNLERVDVSEKTNIEDLAFSGCSDKLEVECRETGKLLDVSTDYDDYYDDVDYDDDDYDDTDYDDYDDQSNYLEADQNVDYDENNNIEENGKIENDEEFNYDDYDDYDDFDTDGRYD